MTDPVFFVPSRRYTAFRGREFYRSRARRPAHGDRLVSGIASASEGGEGMLVFVEGRRNAALPEKLTAAAVLCTGDIADQVPAGIAVLVTRGRRAFARSAG